MMQNVTHLVKNLWNMQNSFISLIHYCSSSIKDTDSCNTQYIFFMSIFVNGIIYSTYATQVKTKTTLLSDKRLS